MLKSLRDHLRRLWSFSYANWTSRKNKDHPEVGKKREREREIQRQRERGIHWASVRGTHIKSVACRVEHTLGRLSTDVSCIISRAAVCALCAYRLQLIVIKCIPFGCNNMLQTHACHTASPWQDKLIDAINSRLSLLKNAADFDLRHFCAAHRAIVASPSLPPLCPLYLPPSLSPSACSFSALSLCYGSAFCARC